MAIEMQLYESGKEHPVLKAFSMEAFEALSTPFQITVVAHTDPMCDPASVDAASWLNKQLALCIADDRHKSWFNGILAVVEHIGEDEQKAQIYRLEIASGLAQLRHSRRTRVFTETKPLEVVKRVLSEAGLAVDMKAQGATSEAPRHITQFEESDFTFVSRLLEQEGASYWFEHSQSAHKLVIGDTAQHQDADHPINGHYIASFSTAERSGEITSLVRRFEIMPKQVEVIDYSEKHPKQAALGRKSVQPAKVPVAKGTMREADYHATASDADATAFATRVAEGLACRACRIDGASGIILLRCPSRLHVLGRDDHSEDMLIERVQHRLDASGYTNSFNAVPITRLPWRPLRTTPLPRIDGFVPAIITASAGSQGSGEDGSYKVKLLNCDTSKERIVRMAQAYAGPAQGIHFPLPVNTEVVLAHEFGHPDRPVIAGAMHNAEDPSPVLESNKSQCVVKSAAGAVLIFEDKEGEEKITLQSKSTNKLEFEDKSGSEKVTLYAKKDHAVTVDGKSETKVTGKKTIDGQDEISITAAKKLVLKCGEASITLEPSGKITISGTEITISGKTKVAADAAEISLAAKGKLAGTGAMISLEAKATLEAKANGPVTVESSAITQLKGAMVMIN